MNVARPIFPAYLLQLLLAALLLAPAPAAAQLVLPSTLSMSPSSATGGGTILVSASRLADGDYEVALLAGREPLVLVDIRGGTGGFGRYVTLPPLPAGSYAVELRVNGALTHSRSYKILSPLAVTPATTSPRAGSSLAFSVSGLSEGSLSLVYDGKVAFGPVSVSGGSFSGKLVLPTDRPARLPASVTLQARNATGKTVPRVGDTTLSVQTPDRNPLVRIGASSTSATSIGLREPLSATGSLATNELEPAEATVQYWWRDAEGRVVPMGAQRSSIGADGGFSAVMRAPQMGTMSALGAAGQGVVFAVGQGRDRYGTSQQLPGEVGSPLEVGFDTDAAIDVRLNLRGSDGLAVEGARVVLSTSQLDELYPPDDNSSPISLDGGVGPLQMPSQYQTPVDEALGCPDDIERQTSNGNGTVEFEFDLTPPQNGFNIDGSGPPPTLTIAPSEDCIEIPTNPGDSATRCTLVDPAGIHVQLTVIAAHTGYGWVNVPGFTNNPIVREVPLRVDVRVDRYTGRVSTRTCQPDTDPTDAYVPPCEEADFDRSATLNLVLPKLARTGLQLTEPSWQQGAYAGDFEVRTREGGLVVYKPMPDLGDFEDRATFDPAQPRARRFSIGYVRGAGETLASAELHFFGRSEAIPLVRAQGDVSCDVAATEVWSADLPQDVLEGLWFPRRTFGITSNQLYGWVVAHEEGTERVGMRAFRFDFKRPAAKVRAMAGQPGLTLHTYFPHAVKLTAPPNDATGQTNTGAANRSGCDDDDCDDYAELQDKSNFAEAHLDLELCLPGGDTQCGSYSRVDSSHQQYSSPPDVQPPGATFTGAGGGRSTESPWEVLFDKTIPLFRWYWGVPEVFSAEVFADLGIKAEYLFNYVLDPLEPLASYVETGGRMGVLIAIGVDVDVLFGILVDAGAQISGSLVGEVVGEARAADPTNPCFTESLDFSMDFSYWVEIGCPIDFPLDPTCWIPDIEGSHEIFDENIARGSSCLAGKSEAAPWAGIESRLAALGSGALALPPPSAKMATPPKARRAMNRHPALSVDSAGNRLALYVDTLGKLVANDRPVDGLPGTTQLADAPGLRDIAVMHYGVDRAVAVWAQSALRGALPDGADLASYQYLRYAVFDGDDWSAAADLTSPGFGEGGVRLARCVPRPIFLRGDCTGDKVSLVFQRNTAGRIGGESHIFLSRFDGVSWSVPVRVDESGFHNITPAVAYQDAEPVVAWVRYAPEATGLSDIGMRQLALRVMDGVAREELHTRITRIAQPDLATTGDGRLALAYTRPALGDAFVGTRQALHLGQRRCDFGGCSVSAFAVLDEHGRRIYGERPRLVANADGGVNVAFRTLSFGALPGSASPESNRMPGDPAGVATTRGELLNIVSNLALGGTRVMLQSNDAGGHMQAAAAFDPVTRELVTLSGLLPDTGAVLKSRGDDGVRLLAKTKALDEGLQMATLPVLADLAMETLTSDATRLTPGADITVQVGVVNAGSEWTPGAERQATLRLYWDHPATRETLYGDVAIPALAPGERHQAALAIPVPAAFGDDERQTLRAELLIDDPDGEIDGANNAAALSIGGMPVPTGLRALSVPGSRIVNLAWDDPADARVAGYRIWIDGDDGRPLPIGSSFNLGFADLSALYGFVRHYRVSTYSERGIESELSEAISVEPAPAIIAGDTDGLFEDGFE